jgi:hypothetical protein
MTTRYLFNGKIVSGLVLREEGEVYAPADNLRREVRIPRDAVEGRTLSNLLPMPTSVPEQVPEAGFYHLLTRQPAPETATKDQPVRSRP